MAWAPGQSGNAAGKPKGSTSKIGKEIREAIHGALNEAGGKEYLLKLAREKPQVFIPLLCKIVPQELEIEIRYQELSEEEIDAMLTAKLGIMNNAESANQSTIN